MSPLRWFPASPKSSVVLPGPFRGSSFCALKYVAFAGVAVDSRSPDIREILRVFPVPRPVVVCVGPTVDLAVLESVRTREGKILGGLENVVLSVLEGSRSARYVRTSDCTTRGGGPSISSSCSNSSAC